MGSQTTMPCAEVEDNGLLGPLQSPNWVKVCLVSAVFVLPVSIETIAEKCIGLSVGDRVLCLRVRASIPAFPVGLLPGRVIAVT